MFLILLPAHPASAGCCVLPWALCWGCMESLNCRRCHCSCDFFFSLIVKVSVWRLQRQNKWWKGALQALYGDEVQFPHDWLAGTGWKTHLLASNGNNHRVRLINPTHFLLLFFGPTWSFLLNLKFTARTLYIVENVCSNILYLAD